MHKELGKISSVSFGRGGYQGCQFGLFVTLDFNNCSTVASIGSGWDAATMECTAGARWTEPDRTKGHDDLCRKVSQLLKDAKIESVDQLKGIPVEVTLDNPLGTVKDWRILTEVL